MDSRLITARQIYEPAGHKINTVQTERSGVSQRINFS
jgi:hypothetical protein